MKVEEPEVLEIFSKCNAIEKGHFIIENSLHTNICLKEKDVMQYVTRAHYLCYGIAERFAYDYYGAEVIIGLGGYGAILAPWTAQNMSNITGRKVSGVAFDKVDISTLAGKNVLVVEGILTTGDAARKVVTAVRKMGGNVIGMGALWNRGGITPQYVDVPKIHALVNTRLYAWTKAQCLHCELGIPITDVGWKWR